MAKPTVIYDWAVENIAENIQDKNGNSVLVVNKLNPALDAVNSGIRARSPFSRGNYNYLQNAQAQHLDYLYEGEVGRVEVFADSAGYTTAEMESWYGGTWVDRGTDIVFGQTLRLFEKTA